MELYIGMTSERRAEEGEVRRKENQMTEEEKWPDVCSPGSKENY